MAALGKHPYESVKHCTAVGVKKKYMRNIPVNTMVREGGRGGVQVTEAGISLQPTETMVDQVFPEACKDHGGADIHAAGHK